MAFFETLTLLRARGGQHQPGPTMPPFHVYSPFPTSDPRSYPIHESSNLSTLALFWTLNSPCTLLLLKLYNVLPGVKHLP